MDEVMWEVKEKVRRGRVAQKSFESYFVRVILCSSGRLSTEFKLVGVRVWKGVREEKTDCNRYEVGWRMLRVSGLAMEKQRPVLCRQGGNA